MEREIIGLAAAEHVPIACIMGFVILTQFIATVRLLIETWEKRQDRRNKSNAA